MSYEYVQPAQYNGEKIIDSILLYHMLHSHSCCPVALYIMQYEVRYKDSMVSMHLIENFVLESLFFASDDFLPHFLKPISKGIGKALEDLVLSVKHEHSEAAKTNERCSGIVYVHKRDDTTLIASELSKVNNLYLYPVNVLFCFSFPHANGN